MAELFYINPAPSSDIGAHESGQTATPSSNSPAAPTQPAQSTDARLISRVESLENLVDDLRSNAIRKDSDASLNSLNVRDKINAYFGKIGGWLISAGVLSTSKIEIDSNNSHIKSTNYQEGVSGFKISAEKVEAENLIARGTMRGSVFSYDHVSAVGGQLMVANADTLKSDMSNRNDSVLEIKGDTEFISDDFIAMRGIADTGIQEEWLRIVSPFTKNLSDSYSESNFSHAWLTYSPYTKEAQSFTATGGKLAECKFYLSKYGSPTGNVYAKLYAHSGTYGVNGQPTGTAIATSDPIDIASLSTSASLITFTFSGINQVQLTSGGKYFIAYEYSGGDISNRLSGAIDETSPTHSGNACEWNGSSWDIYASYDIPFYVYEYLSDDKYIVERDLAGQFGEDAKPAWKAGTPVVKQGSWSATSGNKYTAPVLTGLTGHSAASVFDALGQGSNNGKIKINIDGSETDISVDLLISPTKTVSFESANSAAGISTTTYIGQIIKTDATSNLIHSVVLKVEPADSGGTLTLEVKAVSAGLPTGAVLATTSTSTIVSGNEREFVIDMPCTPSTSYAFYVKTSTTSSVWLYTSGGYADGTRITSVNSGSSWSANSDDCWFKLYQRSTMTLPVVASNLQTSLRAWTSRLETVAYVTDHFVITGVTPDCKILASSPDSGTDLSGLGATPYLNLAGGTSLLGGYGDGGWLRLIGEGENAPYYSVFKRLSGAYNDFQEACRFGNLNGFLTYSSDEYGMAIGDATGYLTYDPTNGLRLGGTSSNFFQIIASDSIISSADNNADISNISYTKVKEILFNDISGIIRVKATITNIGATTVYGRFYKNGVAVGTEFSTTSTVASSQDFSVLSGDLIQLYIRGNNTGTVRGSLFRLCYDKQVKPVSNTINLN